MIKSIKITNYRNISSLFTKFEKINLIIEKNGTGKTNFLEAIYFQIFQRSFRKIQNNNDIIGPQKEYAKSEIEIEIGTLETVISTSNDKTTKTVKLGGKGTLAGKLPFLLPIVLFAPHSVDLLTSQPMQRRDDLDDFLSTVFSEYKTTIAKYSKILRNRNALLKRFRDDRKNIIQLDFWTSQLIDTGFEIFMLRKKFFDEINGFITMVAEEIFNGYKSFACVYRPSVTEDQNDFKMLLAEKFRLGLEKEIRAGKTLYGIHKDDFAFILNDLDLIYFGSRGQQRIGAFLLKVAQIKYLEKTKDLGNYDIVFLVDDIFSELDSIHREKISIWLVRQDLAQIILTGAVLEEFPKIILENSQILKI